MRFRRGSFHSPTQRKRVAELKMKKPLLSGQFRPGKITCHVCGKEGFWINATKQVLHKSMVKGKFGGHIRQSSLCNLLEAA